MAVTERSPAGRADETKAAVPPVIVAVPSVFAPSRNVTVPVAGDGDTDAVNVMLWPAVDGFREDVTSVAVESAFTVCVTAVEVLFA